MVEATAASARVHRSSRSPRSPRVASVPVPADFIGTNKEGTIDAISKKGKHSFGFIAIGDGSTPREETPRIYFNFNDYTDEVFAPRRGYAVAFTCLNDDKGRAYASALTLTEQCKAQAIEKEALAAAAPPRREQKAQGGGGEGGGERASSGRPKRSQAQEEQARPFAEMKGKPRYLLVMDFEANCTSEATRDHEIIEFPCVLLDTEGEAGGEFRTFIKPVLIPKISDFIHQLTGITDQEVASGLTWAEALVAFDAWCGEKGLDATNSCIATCGDWDLKTACPRMHSICKTEETQPPRVATLLSRWINVKMSFSRHQEKNKAGSKRAKGMDKMLEEIGLPLIGRHHSGIDDCRNIAAICKWLLEQGGRDEYFSCAAMRQK